MTLVSHDHQAARRHLARKDPVMRHIIKAVGPCTLRFEPDGFGILARSIISQQISTKAALAIGGRLLKTLGRSGLKPGPLLKLTDEQMRAAGLSANKVKSLRDLAEKVHGKAVPLARLPKMTDEEVIECLLPVRGIGRWTAEMFLIFSLGRLDVLPVDDFGFRAGVRDAYGFPDLPNKAQLSELTEPWRPYRTIGTWYVWRSRGGVPQS